MIRISRIVLPVVASALALGSVNAFAAGNDAKHFPGIFLGYTDTKYDTEFTYGLEYEYKFNPNWGVGAVYEKTEDGHKGDGITVKLASLYYHPVKNVRLGLGAGREKIGGAHPHSESLYRVSASYDFHVGDFGVAPTLAVDFVDGNEAYVVGVALIKPF